MFLLVFKYSITAFIIVLVSEVAKRSDRFGSLISSLPFVTIMVMTWLYLEKQGTEKIANHAYYTFWYVIPTLPMFLLMPFLLHRGFNYGFSLFLCVLLTIVSFILTAVIVKRFGINLI